MIRSSKSQKEAATHTMPSNTVRAPIHVRTDEELDTDCSCCIFFVVIIIVLIIAVPTIVSKIF